MPPGRFSLEADMACPTAIDQAWIDAVWEAMTPEEADSVFDSDTQWPDAQWENLLDRASEIYRRRQNAPAAESAVRA